MDRDIDSSELMPCDVLLYHGGSTVSQLIQWFDGSEYSHSSIFDGKMVVDAIPEGVRRRTLKTTMKDTLYADVWRFRKDGVLIGTPELPAEPVLEMIKRYVDEGDRFACEEVVLLAVLCTTRRLPLPFLRWALDRGADLLVRMVDGGKEPMASSELVYRCFDDAGQEYQPRIRGVDIRAKIEIQHPPAQPDEAIKDADRLVAEFFDLYASAKHMETRDDLLLRAMEADPNFVTPKDLKKSSDFEKIGRLFPPS